MLSRSERLEILYGRYEEYLRAERAVLHGQSYTVEGLSVTRAQLREVRGVIGELEREILRLEREASGRGRIRVRYVVPSEGKRVMRRQGM